MQTRSLHKDVWLWIDPSQHCNISCALCYTKPSQARQFLSTENLSVLANKINRANVVVKEITFNWRGEPLSNRIFPALLRQLIDSFPNVRIQFHTNAMLLSDRVCNELCGIGQPYFIYLSIDGGSQYSHERNRGQHTFDQAVRGGHNLLNRRGAKPWPYVTLYQLDLGVESDAYSQEFHRLAVRCDKWERVRPIMKNGLEMIQQSNPSEVGWNPSEMWTIEQQAKQPDGACFWVGHSLSIAPDGTVHTCIMSQSSDGTSILGNIIDDDVDEIIETAERLRLQLNTLGRSSVAHCKSCFKIEGNARAPRPTADLRSGVEGKVNLL